MREEGYHHELSQSKQYGLKAINRMALGSILILFGGLLTLRQVGIIAKDVSTWPFVFIAFGTLLVIGGILQTICEILIGEGGVKTWMKIT